MLSTHIHDDTWEFLIPMGEAQHWNRCGLDLSNGDRYRMAPIVVFQDSSRQRISKAR